MPVDVKTAAGWGEKVVSQRAKEHTSIPSQLEHAPFVRPRTPISSEMTSTQQVKAVMLKGERPAVQILLAHPSLTKE